MGTLFDITGEFIALYELATAEDDQQAFVDTFDSLMGELEVKAEGYVNVIKQLEMEQDECDKVIETFKKKKKVRANNVKRMKEALIAAMDVAKKDSISAGNYTLKIANNGGVQPLEIDDDVPDSYMKVIYEPDKDKIREALKEGQELDFAHLKERGRHLNIK